jgi:hypothetical protein
VFARQHWARFIVEDLRRSRTQQHLLESTSMRGDDDKIEFFVFRNLADARSRIPRVEHPGAFDERKLLVQKESGF